jgi:hypothetical protein
MVATYVELVVGIRLTDREACRFLLGLTDEEYDKAVEGEDKNFSLFTDHISDSYMIDSKKWIIYGINVFSSICCSDTTDVVVGISLRKLYRLKIRCEKCDEYTLCDTCFNTTEQGLINYRETYSFKQTCSPNKICRRCHSYNDNETQENRKCRTCFANFEPYRINDASYMLRDVLKLGKPLEIYFHWDDCCSCT